MIILKQLLSETTLRTKRGSIVRRYKNNVGKQVGSQIYVHKFYAEEVIPKAIWDKANSILTRSNPDFAFNTVCFDVKAKSVRFDQAADFDSAREPHVGDYITVWVDGRRQPHAGHSNNIWHHKWLWVKDDYTGFDVDKAKEWSRIWLSKLDEPAKGSDLTWKSQLRNHGLLNENLIMEASDQLAEAALDFLMKMVQNGPFKGKVYLAGGAVRDMELGKTPKDLDVVVVGDGLRGGLNFAVWLAKSMGNYKGPEQYPPQFNFPSHIEVDAYGAPDFSPRENDPELAAALETYNDYFTSFSNPVLFPKFGTAKINLTGDHNGVRLDGMEVEAVASRKEKYTPGSRKPEVFPGTLQDDVYRRDFTTNSLMMDLTTGQVLDITGKGRADIKAGILRTTSDPEVIFREDPLRMLRAVRFMAQKGWKIDPVTEENIKKHAAWLKTISRERVRDELNKMLVTGNPADALRKLRDVGLLPYVAPELQTAVGMTQNKHHVHDVFDHTMEVLKNTKPEVVQRLMALFHDIGKTATRSESPTGVHFYGHEDVGEEIVDKILRDLKYPLEIIQAVKMGVKNHMRLKQGGPDAIKLSDKALRKFKVELGDNLETILDVIHADNIAHADASAMPKQIENVRQRLKALDVQVKKPVLPINGNDLMQMGVPQGPLVGKILSAVTDAWFENPNITREQAILIVKQMYGAQA
jgi:poly(A) polymerase